MRSRCALPPSALQAIMIADVIVTANTATGLAIVRPVGRLRTMLRVARRLLRRSSCTSRRTAPVSVTMAAVVIAITTRVATAGFAVTGRRSRGRARAGVAADAAGTALDTSSLRSVADNGHSSAVAAPLRQVPRRRFPLGECSTNRPLTDRGRLRLLTPHASKMQRAQARAEPAFSTTWGNFERLRASGSCLTESLLWRSVAKPLEWLDIFRRASLENVEWNPG